MNKYEIWCDWDEHTKTWCSRFMISDKGNICGVSVREKTEKESMLRLADHIKDHINLHIK